MNQPHDSSQPFVGHSAFAHKGGIHVAAVLKNEDTYQHINPKLVGNQRRVLISEVQSVCAAFSVFSLPWSLCAASSVFCLPWSVCVEFAEFSVFSLPWSLCAVFSVFSLSWSVCAASSVFSLPWSFVRCIFSIWFRA
jgi:hypothetical protein